MGVGIVAGFGFGIYLADLRDITESISVDGPSLSVIPSATEFVSGQVVQLHIVNSGTVPISFNDTSYGLEITGLAGVIIFSPVSQPISSVLAPGESIVLSWDQIKNNGDVALDGLYKINVRGESTGETVLGSATFTIR